MTPTSEMIEAAARQLAQLADKNPDAKQDCGFRVWESFTFHAAKVLEAALAEIMVEGSVPIVGYEYELAQKTTGGVGVEWSEPMLKYRIPPHEDGWRVRNVTPLIRQSAHLAALVDKDAEIERLGKQIEETTADSFLEHQIMKRRFGDAS